MDRGVAEDMGRADCLGSGSRIRPIRGGVWVSVGWCMAPRSASPTAGWVKVRGELALRNGRELRQPGLEALQREQDMLRGGAAQDRRGSSRCRSP